MMVSKSGFFLCMPLAYYDPEYHYYIAIPTFSDLQITRRYGLPERLSEEKARAPLQLILWYVSDIHVQLERHD